MSRMVVLLVHTTRHVVYEGKSKPIKVSREHVRCISVFLTPLQTPQKI